MNRSSQPSRQQPQNLAAISEAMRGMTPDNAKEQVEAMLHDGRMSGQQFEALKAQAQNICGLLGIK